MKILLISLTFLFTLLIGCDKINSPDKILNQKNVLGTYIGKINLISIDESGSRKPIRSIDDTIIFSAISATRNKYESKILGVFYGELNLDKAKSSKIPISIDEQSINSPLITTPNNDLIVSQQQGSTFDFGKEKINNNSQLKVSSSSGNEIETQSNDGFVRTIAIILDSESRDIPLIRNTGGR